MPLGLYISVPFCRTKCTYCNFASDVFSRTLFEKYITRLCGEIECACETAKQVGGLLEPTVDSIYFGGGTPTLLTLEQLDRIFVTIRQNFDVRPDAEITLECAPGTLSADIVECLVQNKVNRVSLGVQSFVDQEARSVGRLHTRAVVLDDISHLRSAGIGNINVDLIAGLPHQTRYSWEQSLNDLIATGVPHASVYMLEVDEDSRLGRELIAGGQKYHAHFVPDEDLTADMYEVACERLNAAGIWQYEISNFAQPEFESQHNLKYWTRQPYLGFGVDAHSMLLAGRFGNRCNRANNPPEGLIGQTTDGSGDDGNSREPYADRKGHDFQPCRPQPVPMDGTAESRALPALDSTNAPGAAAGPIQQSLNAVRFCNPDSLEKYLQGSRAEPAAISWESALEETCFLGLRLTQGLNLNDISVQFGNDALAVLSPTIAECVDSGLMERKGDYARLTAKGQLLSNEVFGKFITEPIPLSS
jgi:putative oxygen-independent coproporphyrinogen III oxidase